MLGLSVLGTTKSYLPLGAGRVKSEVMDFTPTDLKSIQYATPSLWWPILAPFLASVRHTVQADHNVWVRIRPVCVWLKVSAMPLTRDTTETYPLGYGCDHYFQNWEQFACELLYALHFSVYRRSSLKDFLITICQALLSTAVVFWKFGLYCTAEAVLCSALKMIFLLSLVRLTLV